MEKKKNFNDKKKQKILIRSFFETRFSPSALIIDDRGKISNKILSGMDSWKNWRISEHRIEFTSENSISPSTKGYLSYKNLGLNVESSDSLEKYNELVKKYIKTCWNIVPSDSFVRIGFRTMTIVPLEMKFEELLKIISEKSFSQNIQKFSPEDLAITIDSEYRSMNTHMQFGPVKSEQAIAQMGIEEGVADVSLFIDLDIFIKRKEGRLKQSDVLELVDKSIKIRAEEIEKLIKTLGLKDGNK